MAAEERSSAVSALNTSPYEGLAISYSEGRPSYPDEAIADLCGLTGKIVDVGAGTGILTRQIARLLPLASVIGIEPSDDMRRMAQSASADIANITFMAGSAEMLPFAAGEVTLMTVATAVHWFDRPVFYAEAFRSIKPSGRLVVLQNIRRWWNSEWLAAYEDLHESTVKGYRRGTFPAFDGRYRALDVAAELSAHEGASSVTTRDFEWGTTLSEKEFVRFSLSSSITQRAIATIGEPAYLDRLTRLIRTHSSDGAIPIDYITRVTTATRAEAPIS